jgi:preprotein translocase subunit SecF
MKFAASYDKNYKKLLIIPAVVLALSLIYLTVFYVQNDDIIYKDVSLTGGSTITISTDISQQDLEAALAESFNDFSITAVSGNSGNQLELIITVGEEHTEALELALETFLGYELTSENSSIETTSAALSADFYKQLIVAILLAFFWMAAVVFLIFAKGKKVKTWVIVLNVFLGFFMGNFFLSINAILSAIIFLALAALLVYIYIKNSVPAFAVMLSAFADIVMTLAVVDLLGIKLSTAGIVAFLMLIGYSVDTDILLTTRLLKKKESINSALLGAFKTGTTMTITSIIAIITALIVVYSFASVLNQIFTILLIGLAFDLFNTWITNASIIKWYVENKDA